MELNFLGRSNSTICMLFESLFQLHGTGIKVKIIENIEVKDDLVFGIDAIETEILQDTRWDAKADLIRQVRFVMGVYKPKAKMAVFNHFRIKYGILADQYINIVDPSVTMARSVRLNHGISIGPATVVAPFAELGNLVSSNRKVSIGHHTSIGAFSSVNPGVNIAGRCVIGEGVTIGMGANIVDGIHIGDHSVIGAGSLVTENIPPNTLAYGVPAKIIKSY